VVDGADDGEPLTLRSLDDARRIRAAAAGSRSVCVLGAGLAGLEMAMALRGLDKDVSVVAASAQVLSRNAGPDEARVVQGLLEAAGIRHIAVPFTRSFTPLTDLRALLCLVRIMRRERFTQRAQHAGREALVADPDDRIEALGERAQMTLLEACEFGRSGRGVGHGGPR